MADIVTGTVTGQLDNSALLQDHADIRREASANSADIRREVAMGMADTRFATASGFADTRRELAQETGAINVENMKGFDRVNADVLRSAWAGVDATKDSRHDIADRIATTSAADAAQGTAFYIAAQKNATDAATALSSLTALQAANTAAIAREVASSADRVAAANALEGAKNAAAAMLGQATIVASVRDEGERTRTLINDLKYHDLNRALVERNAELVEERESRRHYRDRADQYQSQGQWASVQAQLQAFQSQFQQATQGTVNFGTMSGNAGRNTSTNNVV